jgi:3-mercaptopyruvate sulfurtransferase SseA
MAGAWLRLMGHRDVFAVEGGLTEPAAVTPPVDDGIEAIPDGAVVVDLARSIDYRAGHIPGALWGIRTRLDALQDRLAAARHVVVTSPDGALAPSATAEIAALTQAPVAVLRGGTAGWVARGGVLEASRTVPADEECVDFYLRPYDRNSGVEAAMHAYLSWEIDLVREIQRDGTVAFGV